MKLARSLAPLLAALALAAATPPALAQEEPVTAGSEGVPAPKRTKHVQPVYPQEALAQGIRGIVILEIILDKQGKVESTAVVRSVPGLDEAAVAAARQWEYTPTKVDGKPVRVRITVPVVFSLALPTVSRQTGIPELRQGISPVWPVGASGGGIARAEVTLEADGRVGSARILEGNPPWSDALLAALKTWRFGPPPEDEVLTFRVEAEFVAEGGGKDRRVSLEATGLQRSGLLEGPPASGAAKPAPPSVAQAAPPASPAAPAPQQPTPAQEKPTPAPQQPPPTQEKAAPAPQQPTPAQPTPAQPPPAQPTPAQPPPAQPTPQQPVPTQAAPGQPAPAQPKAPQTAPSSPAGRPATPPAATPDATAAPPVEVITAPPPAPPPENGVSAIRDVTLEPGVPDLTKGRRPVAPPFARMAGTTGTVEVDFSVGTAGTTTVQSSTGPDMLKPAAEQAVASWVFRRMRADRAYLVAVFTYGDDRSTAIVRPQAATPGQAPVPTAAPPIPTAPPGSSAPPAGTVTPPAGTTPAPAGTSPAPGAVAPGTPAPPPGPPAARRP